MRVSRLRVPGVTPLEIWDLEMGTRILHDEPQRLFEGLELLRRGEGRTRWSRSPLERCRGFDSVFLGGGRASAPSGPVPYRWELSPDGVFVGERGGRAWLGDGAVVDVGQTAIKVSTPERRVIPRESRRDARALLSGALAFARDRRRILLALPCEVSDACVPGPCSYAGWEGDARLVPDALRAAEVREDAEVFVINDAELAALSCPDLGRKTLVVTVGYSIGAAVKVA